MAALKMLRDGALADPEQIARFHIEAEAAARLQHPGIVQIYDIGTHQGRPYLALEYVAGGSLARFLAGTPQPPRQAAEWLETLARAVQFAHQHGIVHRDLKPANILLQGGEREKGKGEREEVPGASAPFAFGLSPFASPKITDFGLAKRLDVSGSLTSTGAILGTPSYMAPEQTGDPEAADQRIGPAADIHALGAILYEMLTGRPPFQGETLMETLLQVRHHDPVPPSRLRPQLPRDLETITLKCLRKEPAQHYATADELADDLRRFLDEKPIRARPVGRGERLRKWVRRRPAVAALVAVSGLTVLLLLTGLTAGILVLAEKQRQTQRILGLELENKYFLEKAYYFNRNGLALEKWLNGDVPRAESLLNECPEYLHQWEWHYLKRLCHAELLHRAAPTPATGTILSPDGRRVAWAGADGTVHVIDLASEKSLCTLTGCATPVSALAFADNGSYLAAAGQDRTIHVWHTGSGQEVDRFQGHTARINGLAFRLDGRWLASASADHSVRVWNVQTGQTVWVLVGHTNSVRAVAFRPDGRQLASAGDDQAVRLWDVVAGREFRLIREKDDGSALSVAFSPDGRRLASGWTSGRVRLHHPELDPKKADPGIALNGHTREVTSLAFSRDSQFLASGSADRFVRMWQVTTGESLRLYRGPATPVISVAFGPRGQQLAAATAASGVRVWDATREQLSRALDHPDDVQYLAFSPDGQSLASVARRKKDRRQTLRVWDPVTGTMRWQWSRPGGPVAFRPDGKVLAVGGSDGTVFFLEPDQGAIIRRSAPMHQGPITSLSFIPRADGALLASAAWQELKVWDIEKGERFAIARPNQSIRSLIHSRDGRRLAFADDQGNVQVVEADTGAPVFTHREAGQRIWGLALSPDGRFLAAAILRNWPTVKVWDLANGEEYCTLGGHTDRVRAVAFSPDGERLATASFDRTIKLWDWRTEKEVLTLRGHKGLIQAVVFSPDGRRLASAAADGQVRLWDATPLDVSTPARR